MTLGSTISDSEAATRSRAIRLLLRRPLLSAAEAANAGLEFRELARHAERLRRWFDDVAGWALMVDTRRGFARLTKTTGFGDPSRPARSTRGARRPFTRRRYVLLCLLMAELESAGRQMTLRDLVESIRAATAELDDIVTFDPTSRDERSALVDALLLLIDLGVLDQRDTRDDYIDRPETANALYHLDTRRLSVLLATPRPIATSSSPSEVFHEDRYGPWTPDDAVGSGDGREARPPHPPVPAWLESTDAFPRQRQSAADDTDEHTVSEEQQRLGMRHSLMRRLLDDPVLYYDDLDAGERAYLTTIVGWAGGKFAEAGFELERRAEGWVLIDPEGLATDIAFPAGETGSNMKQAALLTLDALVGQSRAEGRTTFSRGEVTEQVVRLLAEHPKWAGAYQGDGGAGLTREVVELLSAMRLLAVAPAGGPVDDVIELRPAGARYAVRLRQPTPERLWESA